MYKFLNLVFEYLFCFFFVIIIIFIIYIIFVIEIVIYVYIYNCWNVCNKLMSKIGMMIIWDCLLIN